MYDVDTTQYFKALYSTKPALALGLLNITLIMSDQFQSMWEKAVTGNGRKLCNGGFRN